MASSSHNCSYFVAEIQNIMHGFGDHPRPLAESAKLIEEIVHQQMTQLLHQALQVANMRNSRFIGLEDVLFLMRNDKVKLARLFRYLSVKDLKSQVVKSKALDGSDNGEDLSIPVSLSADRKSTQTKRVKLCYDFISSIDQTGDLLTAFDEDFFDEIRHQRNLVRRVILII